MKGRSVDMPLELRQCSDLVFMVWISLKRQHLKPCFIPKATCVFSVSSLLHNTVYFSLCENMVCSVRAEIVCQTVGSYQSTTSWNYNCNFVLIYTVYPAHFNISLSLFADPLFPPREQLARHSVTDGTASSTPPSYTHRPIACPPVLRQITDILSH